MSIKRYLASKDNTITNQYDSWNQDRMTGSNVGESDIVEVNYIKGKITSASVEKTRALMQFPVSTIISDRNAGNIPASGSVSFYLRLYNSEHQFTTPRNFWIAVEAVSGSWEEGTGLDHENGKDEMASNWVSSSTGVLWDTEGGDVYSSPVYSQYFDKGIEDLEVDITGLMEQWIAGTKDNHGVRIKMSGSSESGSTTNYTKRFYARESEYFHKRPIIEARWNSSKGDDRGYFFASSSAVSADDNLNTLYLYNYVRGELKNLPGVGTGSLYVSFHTSRSAGEQLTATPNNPATASWISTGIYSCSTALNTTASIVYDRWYSGSIYYHTGSISIKSFGGNSNWNLRDRFIINITNLKDNYYKDEIARFRVFTRKDNRTPTIYDKAINQVEIDVLDKLYYKVVRVTDNYDIIEYGTGSLNHTKCSYDVSGSYFDLDISMLEPDYAYAIKFLYKRAGDYREHPKLFKFRVEEVNP